MRTARPVPYHLRNIVEGELERLDKIGVIIPITYSEWASPTVNVIKSDKKVRICADFKETLNPVCNTEQYPLLSPEDIFANLARGQHFTKLDLSRAYHQLKLSADSQKHKVISTHKASFAYTKFQYGLNNAVGIFQLAMENILKNIPFIAVYLDNIIITAPTIIEEHYKIFELVLHRFHDFGLKLKREKCIFMTAEVN